MENKQPTIYLDTPAAEWETAYPIGAGSIAAMIYGQPAKEEIQLNEESIWSGNKHPIDENNDFREKLDKVRGLMLEGKIGLANRTATEIFDGYFETLDSYETAGEIYVETGCTEYTDYRRELLLDDGICKITYKADGNSFTRESFASYPAKMLAFRFTSEKPASYKITYERESLLSKNYTASGIDIEGITVLGEHKFSGRVKVETDGKYEYSADGIKVSGSKFVNIFVTFATQYRFDDEYQKVCGEYIAAAEKGYDALREEAVKDHCDLMVRSRIEFESDPALDELPMSARLNRLREDENATDPSLIAIYYSFGKYLLIGSSRPGTLPANLQGVWNPYMKAPWNADYHTNINLQMNYWPAEVANISECTLPLFDYMNNNLLESGKEIAMNFYRVEGTVVHHISDIYGFTKPGDGLHGLWPIGGAWLCYHMWDHYLYTGDEDFLRDTAYDYIHESAKFFINYMYFDKERGYYVTGPSASPENSFYTGDVEGEKAWLSLAPTMDVEVISGLLRLYIAIEDKFGIDKAMQAKAADVLSKMLPLRIGKYGQLCEWEQDFEETELGHRHVSHAFALYPDGAINRSTPELFNALKVTMHRRLSNGGGHTGWSRAWLISLYARLYDGENAYKHIRALFCNCTKENLFDIHPPFQIDGNFGGAAGIAETLLHSHNDEISLLPAIDDTVKTGKFSGLCARGGVEVSAEWTDKKLTKVTLVRKYGTPQSVKIHFPEANGGGEKYYFVGASPVEITF